MQERECDILIVGGGTGGCAAAMAACSLGMRVILTEANNSRGYDETKSNAVLGGQLTNQLVPPDEHAWIEEFGCTARYREFRNRVRERAKSTLNDAAKAEPFLNPGGGWVSRLCYRIGLGTFALKSMLNEEAAHGSLTVIFGEPISVESAGDTLIAISIYEFLTGETVSVHASYFLDATELGDVAPLARAEYRVGSESQSETNEPHATKNAEPANIQGFTWCFALKYDEEKSHVRDRPEKYSFWRDYRPPGWPGPLFSFVFPDPITGNPRELPLFGKPPDDRFTLFTYRQVEDPRWHPGPRLARAATVVNWPQNDYFLGSVTDVAAEVKASRLEESKQLGRCLLFWLQTEAPRHDGGLGYPGLRMVNGQYTRNDDGFAQMPYHRESRRMVTRFTVTEQLVAADCNPGLDRAPAMPKSVGVGHYRIDLHPSANGHGYIDIPSLPFQIPLGSLIPVRLRNLLPACKNLGVTHITNGCYRLHPVEWNIGEAAGLLAAFCVTRKSEPAAVYETEELWQDFERLVHAQGIETMWPNVPLTLP